MRPGDGFEGGGCSIRYVWSWWDKLGCYTASIEQNPEQGPLNTYFLHSHHLTFHWFSSHADADAYHDGGRRCGHPASRLTSTLWFPGPSCGRSARNQRFELDTSNVTLWPLPEDCSSSESHTGDQHCRICRRLHLYMTCACPLDALNELHAMSCMRIHVLVALRAWFSGDQSLAHSCLAPLSPRSYSRPP